MGRDISIMISAKDNFTDAITTMTNASRAFEKGIPGLQSKLDTLNKTKVTLKVDVDKLKKELKEAEKQFAKTGNEADKLKLELANADYENARRNLSLVSDNAKQAEKDIKSLTNAVSKTENRASSSKKSMDGILGSLATSGAAALVGNVLSDIANVGVSSAFGSEVSNIFGSALSTGGMGAAIGTAIAPGIGTAIGAALGAGVGIIQGATKNFEMQDNAFKSYYQEQYNTIQQSQTDTQTRGTAIASTREQDRISFATLLGGNQNAATFLGDLTRFASETPFEYDDLTNISKTLLAYGYTQEELLPLLTKVGDAGSALGMGMEDMRYVATALGRMQTTGKTTLEYLNPLLERGIDVWGYLAEASGKTKQEVQDMVSKGLVPGGEAAKAIADYMGADFAGNMEKQAQTFLGLTSSLSDAQSEIDNAMGVGYNTGRKTGLQEQIDWLSGESGESMKEAYNKIGQWKASLENLSEEYQRDAIESVMSGVISDIFEDSDQKEALEKLAKEYTLIQADFYDASKTGNQEKMQEAGATMGRILAEAEAIAQNEYNASEGAQLLLETNKTLANNLKNDAGLQESYWDAGYEMGIQFSKGMASAVSTSQDDAGTAWLKEKAAYTRGAGRGYAYGLNYVPYDNYPAILHEGERVLTASENRSLGKGAEIKITGNSFVVREEADIPKVAAEIIRQMNQAYILAQ